ncbi:adenosine deaminase [Neptunicoccus cionae]|uniref:adenosine deaminase n=1 Tax=Neptunicoccus cionae TaxID=2035344 RepID=UPI000C76D569|nr:adenosine deaminase [Amylibacter cionae]PLS22942.1 adenosine deaminase [Amylibacter cionae]
MELYQHLQKLPKVELHLHLEGAIRPQTAVELARKNGVSLPHSDRPDDLYDYNTLDAFLDVYDAISKTIVQVDDFRRITYEMLQSASRSGARHVEFFISPHAHEGVPFARQFEGIRLGIKDAQVDFGVTSLIIPGMNRELGPERGEAYLDEILANRGDDVVGLGLDYFEAPYPPEPFAKVFARARESGLKLSAHCGEAGPASYVRGCYEALKVDRLDHGYNVVDDPALMAELRDAGILFTCCPSTTRFTTPHRDLGSPSHPIRVMKQAGLAVSIHSDDPPMFNTDLNGEYVIAIEQMQFSPADIKTAVLATIDHAWVDETTKRNWRQDWMPEIDAVIDAL